jgi:predicted TIM-barrel fold metal-dependent hydrolase
VDTPNSTAGRRRFCRRLWQGGGADHHWGLPRPPLLSALLALDAGHILFGTDYPFEDMATATQFLRTVPISETDRLKIAHGTAERLLGL